MDWKNHSSSCTSSSSSSQGGGRHTEVDMMRLLLLLTSTMRRAEPDTLESRTFLLYYAGRSQFCVKVFLLFTVLLSVRAWPDPAVPACAWSADRQRKACFARGGNCGAKFERFAQQTTAGPTRKDSETGLHNGWKRSLTKHFIVCDVHSKNQFKCMHQSLFPLVADTLSYYIYKLCLILDSSNFFSLIAIRKFKKRADFT